MSLIAASDIILVEAQNKQSQIILNGNSLFFFGPENKFRIFCANITSWRYFDTVSSAVILISTINQSIYNPLYDPKSTLSLVNNYLDIALVIYFTLEAILLIIVNGFLRNGRKSYIKQGWNLMDFFIVVVSLIGLLF